MDRIQAAIARARTSREAVLSGHAEAPAPIRQAAPKRTAVETPAAPAPTVSAPPVRKASPPLSVPTGTADQRWAALESFVPEAAHLAQQRIVTRESGSKSAPFDVLRTRVLQQMSMQGWKRLAISSPGPGCGKSTVTTNLAFALARQGDIRTLVIDLDLRRPMLASLLGLQARHEITAAIRGTSAPASQMVRVADNLAFATTRTAVHDPAELLQGRRIGDLLARFEAEFEPDFILFDLPPLMVSDDAIGFLPNADCALLVAAAEQSTLGQVDICEKELAAQTSVLGVVLNKCSHPGEGQRYGYGYHQDYGQPADA